MAGQMLAGVNPDISVKTANNKPGKMVKHFFEALFYGG